MAELGHAARGGARACDRHRADASRASFPAAGGRAQCAQRALASLSLCRAGSAREARSRARAAPVRAAAETREGLKPKPSFPFTKIVGQENLKLGLILNVIDKRIGGLLLMGDRGTGKSVAVRALVDLLPDIDVVAKDPFNSSPTDKRLMSTDVMDQLREGQDLDVRSAKTPLVELPLGATEDRVCGTLDVENALQQGTKAFSPGLLARANRGILYIDEVNLLDDSLVDVVLDSAAMGVNTVEREGISITHPANFIMIGSGNPEEGELRPQLLDRFGLYVEIFTLNEPEDRTALVMNRTSYDLDPDAFYALAVEEQQELREKLNRARAIVEQVTVSRDLRVKVSTVCSLLDIDGMRGDMVVVRAARAFAAYEGRTEVTEDDIQRVVGMCLGHRTRKDPLDPLGGSLKVAQIFNYVFVQGGTYEEYMERKAKASQPKQAEAGDDAEKKEEGEERSGLKPGQWRGLG